MISRAYRSAALRAYGLAWALAGILAEILVRFDALPRRLFRKGLIPGNWQVTQRLGYGVTEAGTIGARPLWMHCASLGEAKGLWALAQTLVEADSESSSVVVSIVLTANTQAGLRFLKDRCDAWNGAEPGPARGGFGTEVSPRFAAAMAPLDHPAAVGRFLGAWRPRGLCLYETELWPHWLAACRARGLPAVVVSARLTEQAAARYGRFVRAAAEVLDRLDWIQAQDGKDASRFSALTRAPVSVGFDLKAAHFLRNLEVTPAPEAARPALRERVAFLSIHHRELALLLPHLRVIARRVPVSVFPRNLDELKRFRSDLEPMGFVLHSREPGARFSLVDRFGLIDSILPRCHAAFVGGTLIPIGGHNLWEPLLAGVKTFIGPYFHKQEPLASLMLARGLARLIRPEDPSLAFADATGDWSQDEALREASGSLARELRGGADAALAQARAAIFATFYGERPAEPILQGAGKDKESEA